EAEVLTLSPNLFHGHPNIVQLMGWGLCLDTFEDPQSDCCGSVQLPVLVLERAEMNFSQLLESLFTSRHQSLESQVEEGFGQGVGYGKKRQLRRTEKVEYTQ